MARDDRETLPAYLDPLYTAEEMRAADRYAIERHGVGSLDLMERAGAGLARAIADTAPSGRVCIVAGGGHNGADGFVAARVLRAQGRKVDVLTVGALAAAGDPRTALDRLGGPAPVPFTPARLEGSAVVADAMLGTGFEGVAHGPVAAAIAAINACPAPVVAADVPSGVDASTGEARGPAVSATSTSTNHAPKLGLYVGAGAALAGRVVVVDIGIPPGGAGAATAGLITSRARVVGPEPPAGPRAAGVIALDAEALGGRVGMTAAEVARRPLGAVRAAARATGAVVVLVGERPLAATPRGVVAIAPVMATPGLVTRIDALLAAGGEPLAAAAAALADATAGEPPP